MAKACFVPPYQCSKEIEENWKHDVSGVSVMNLNMRIEERSFLIEAAREGRGRKHNFCSYQDGEKKRPPTYLAV
jgi:hypothetical protein